MRQALTAIPNKKPSILIWKVSFLGVLLAIDQLLLPMFHIGGIPFKLSYIFIFTWFLNWIREYNSNVSNHHHKDFIRFFMVILILLFASTLGELVFTYAENFKDHSEFARSFLIYIFYMLAFGLGQQAYKFDCQWLIRIFFIAVLLNLVFIFLKGYTPGWLINIYYDSSSTSNVAGFQSVNSILSMLRPRGLFGNPNISALMINIIVLFIYLAQKNKALVIKSNTTIFGIILLPIFLAMLLGSRGEFIVSMILAYLNYNLYFKTQNKSNRIFIILVSTSIFIAAGASIFFLSNFKIAQDTINRVLKLNTVGSENSNEINDSSRILIFNKVGAFDRFTDSPIWGTGFGDGAVYPYDYGTEYYHNDWARILVTSGFIGLFSMLYLIRYFAWPLGWPSIIPFFLPALVNTFMLCLPASIFYWFMIGVLRKKLST